MGSNRSCGSRLVRAREEPASVCPTSAFFRGRARVRATRGCRPSTPLATAPAADQRMIQSSPAVASTIGAAPAVGRARGHLHEYPRHRRAGPLAQAAPGCQVVMTSASTSPGADFVASAVDALAGMSRVEMISGDRPDRVGHCDLRAGVRHGHCFGAAAHLTGGARIARHGDRVDHAVARHERAHAAASKGASRSAGSTRVSLGAFGDGGGESSPGK